LLPIDRGARHWLGVAAGRLRGPVCKPVRCVYLLLCRYHALGILPWGTFARSMAQFQGLLLMMVLHCHCRCVFRRCHPTRRACPNWCGTVYCWRHRIAHFVETAPPRASSSARRHLLSVEVWPSVVSRLLTDRVRSSSAWPMHRFRQHRCYGDGLSGEGVRRYQSGR